MKETFDAFERQLHDALQGDEMPSSDFSDRVMAQVRNTPQEKKTKTVSKFKTWQIAACAAVVAVVAVPVVMMTTMRAGSAAPQVADCCEEAEEAAVDGAAEAFSFTMTAGEPKTKETANEDSVNEAANVMQETVIISDPAVAKEALAWLTENGYVDDGGYLLSAEEAAQLTDAVPQAQLPFCTVQLILEGIQ